MHVIGALTFFPSSRDESVWLSSLSSVMVHAPVRSGASWKICRKIGECTLLGLV